MSGFDQKTAAEPVLLLGAGPMAVDYAKVLRELGSTPLVLGRGEGSAARFEAATGIPAGTGDLADQLQRLRDHHGGKLPEAAIVAVSARHLSSVSRLLFQQGVTRLLIEKPAALDQTEMADLLQAMRAAQGTAFVAYNRRFLASVQAAERIIAEDGGAISVFFNFSEPGPRIAALGKHPRELETWFYGNSSHVIDLAFHFSGPLQRLSGAALGGSLIDPGAGIFTGHGAAQSGCQLAWLANWIGPGRWGVEVTTRQHRLIFQPLEKLRLQSHAGFGESAVDLEEAEDLAFKPGLLAQTRAFLHQPEDPRLLPLEEHAARLPAMEAMRQGFAWQAGN